MKHLLTVSTILLSCLLTGCGNGKLQYPQVLDDARKECLPRGGILMHDADWPALRAEGYADNKVEYHVTCADHTSISKVLTLR